MPSVKQDTLKFPIRKTRSSRIKNKENVILNNDCQTSNRSLQDNDNVQSPRKSGRISLLQETNQINRAANKKEKNEYFLESPVKLDRSFHSNENKVTLCFSPNRRCKDTESSEVVSEIFSPKKVKSNCFLSPKKLEDPLKNVPINNRTPQKRLNRLLFDSPKSPCRSPQKFNLGRSPSTLISQLSLRKSPLKSQCISVAPNKLNSKAYQSLKSSFANSSKRSLVGREKEIEQLTEFLRSHLENSLPGSMYVSGAPGTGKTASITSIVDGLKISKLKNVFINCMSKKSAKEIFGAICSDLDIAPGTTEKVIKAQIAKAITSSKGPVLIILDEVDQLECKNQDVLYTIFEWPALKNSKLTLIGIANMLDLTDRVLPRLHANLICKPDLLNFPPYSKDEIVDIIQERIKESDPSSSDVISISAIKFLAGKVASVCGDVRKALDVCRRAVERAEMDHRRQVRLMALRSPCKSPSKKSIPTIQRVDIPTVQSILNEIYGSRVATCINEESSGTFPIQQQVLICTLLLVENYSKIKDINIGKFHEVYSRVCQRRSLPTNDQSEFLSLCSLLESRGMLLLKKSKELRNSKVILRLNQQEAELALGNKTLLQTILEDKVSLGSLAKKDTTKV